MSGQTFPLFDSLQRPARTICVFNPRGGVGKTTLAVNLAAALAQKIGGEVGLVDLALNTQHCSLMLDLKPKSYLSSLFDWPEVDLQVNEAEELLTSHPSGVVLLSAAESPKEAEMITPAMLEMAWPHLKQKFPFLIVDAGSHFNELSLAAMEEADLILLVFSPDLASLKSTTDAVQIFTEIGIPSSKLWAVANWTFPANPILLKRILPALKIEYAAEIPYDAPGFVKALNTGHPLVIETPAAPAAEVFRALAQSVSEIPVTR
jgi:pilus assembly protein CpaE